MKNKLFALLTLLALLTLTISYTAIAATNVTYTKKGIVMRHIPLPEVPDCQVLKKRLGQEDQFFGYDKGGIMTGTVSNDGASPTAPSESTGVGGGGASDFSTTNIQVEGVDEADIVKNDDKYIYMVKGRTVRVIEAYPPSLLSELAIVEDDDANFTPQELFVAGDRLVVIGHQYVSTSQLRPYYWGGTVTKIVTLDISDKNNIKEVRSVEMEGNYFTSRRIDDQVYLVLQQYPWYYPALRSNGEQTEEGVVPYMTDSLTGETKPMTTCGDVAFFPGYQTPSFLIIASIPLTDPSADIQRKVYLGSTDNVYVSANNLYLAATTYPRFNFFAPEQIPGNVFESSLVYKFELNNGAIEYKGAGEVPGTILNQFSMDEHNGNFRIATTRFSGGEEMSNNLYVLNSSLERIGGIEDIAPGERIYSVRFIGDRAYMVTFKQVDPLFVIDLKDPNNPRILGSLKIPGFSNYLHPYDANHIIGFGKDTEEAKDGSFAWLQGIKIALFDVSDVNNPKEKFKVIIGDRGTESELLYNHKALLFSKEKNLLAFPITIAEIPQEIKNDPQQSQWAYGNQIFQGLQVYSLDLINGFQLKGQVTHHTQDEYDKAGSYIGNYLNDVIRGLYMGDHLYAISQNKVSVNLLSNMKLIKSIELEKSEDDYGYPYPYPEPLPIDIMPMQ